MTNELKKYVHIPTGDLVIALNHSKKNAKTMYVALKPEADVPSNLEELCQIPDTQYISTYDVQKRSLRSLNYPHTDTQQGREVQEA